MRRVRLRPEPEAPKETWGTTVKIPRVLIEFLEQQLAKLGPEPPRLEPTDPTMAALHVATDQWRQRYHASRADMDRDPIAWLLHKNPDMANNAKCVEWMKQVKDENLNAIDAFVSWEQTVGATEANLKAQPTADMYLKAKTYHEQGSAMPSIMEESNSDWGEEFSPRTTDISTEKAPLDRSILERALLTYIARFNANPGMSSEDKELWHLRSLRKGGGTNLDPREHGRGYLLMRGSIKCLLEGRARG